MNPTIKSIQSHSSIRRFQERPIAQDLFEQIVLAGQSASTSSYIQVTTVIQVGDVEKREKLVELTGGQKYVATAAKFLVFCADLQRNKQRVLSQVDEADYSWIEQLLSATVDVSLFAQNMVIAAESAGLGCCYIGGIRNHPEQVSELLELPELVYPVFGLCMGYPDQNPDQKPRLPLASVLHQDRYVETSEYLEEIDAYDAIVKEYYIQRTKGKLDMTWSEQMLKQVTNETRPHMKGFLNGKGFALK